MKLSHFFIPHPETHKKAHLISAKALVVYLFLFLSLQFGLQKITEIHPGVLGVSSNITSTEIIRLTNVERVKQGLPEVVEDSRLSQAAAAKAQNMFQEDYWAHYSPSGKDPWYFINGAGYKFSYAGENLAKSFSTSDEVVKAWMNSPTHRENLLNSHYQNIGIAVIDGTINGEKTTLVVQEFGRPVESIAFSPSTKTQIVQKTEEVAPSISPVAGNVQSVTERPVSSEVRISPFMVTKTFGLSIIGLVVLLILVDYVVLRKRSVKRFASRHVPNVATLSMAAVSLINMNGGKIL